MLKKVYQHLKKQFSPPEVLRAEEEEVSVFPLDSSVLLPGIVMPLHIFEERYKLMTSDCLEKKLLMAIDFSDGKAVDQLVGHVCGAGEVRELEIYPDGRRDILVQGKKRLKIKKILAKKPYIRAVAQIIPDIPFTNLELEQQYHDELQVLSKRLIFLSNSLDDRFIEYVSLFQRPHHLADFIGYYFLNPLLKKQNLLETVSQEERVKSVCHFVREKITELEKSAAKQQTEIQTHHRTLH